ncbi:putative sulfate exporter family transporter [Phenylobacterium kunshanense]|uniref:Putative sulfate exporter family transporter n=1 Tax=Phenylobacterium kunshanense TaxID=1445034 RepID=A0A328BBK7_9CAUL|nr:putative sulfate exporter family transporter [Phenylobacterium kunshanense]RAK64870.1 putative sulfate exporter family transporter [Phenylobacterium kunshanense]
MLKAFTRHPETVGESYFEHLCSAWGFAATMALGALACALHGLFPFAFQTSGSRRIRELHQRMVTHRTTPKPPVRLPAWLPGLALAAFLTLAATLAAQALGAPVAPFALVAGFLVAAPLAGRFDLSPGLRVAERPLLRAGVALLGLRIALGDIAGLGAQTLVLVLSCVALTLALGSVVGRLFGLPKGFSMLSASATAICGASAAMAVSQVLPKSPETERQTAYVVAVVATLSTLAMLAYPAVAHLAGLPPQAAAVFLGTSIHDVAQVAGAGYSVSPQVGDLAVTVKLVRVSLLALVVAAVAFSFAGAAREAKGPGRALLLPGFVIAFFVLAGIRSTGLVPASVLPAATFASNVLIGAGVVAVGARMTLDGLRSMGWRPLAALACQTALLCGLAFAAASWVA